MREKGTQRGVVVVKKDGQSIFVDYNREEYLRDMEIAAYERARNTQARALAEGKQLPEGALRLV